MIFIPILVAFGKLLTSEDLEKTESKPNVKVETVSTAQGNGLKVQSKEHAVEFVGGKISKGHTIPKKSIRAEGMKGSVLYRYHHQATDDSRLIYGVGGGHEIRFDEAHLINKKMYHYKKATKALFSLGYEKDLLKDRTFFIETNLGLPLNTEEQSVQASRLGIQQKKQAKKVDTPEPMISVGIRF
ncbi:MAG: hypothetical protein ACOYK9_00920 [Chlamydiia bacterium]